MPFRPELPDDLVCLGGEIIGPPQPNDYLFSLAVSVLYHLDLLSPFIRIILIDANSIDPELETGYRVQTSKITQLIKAIKEVLCDLE